MTRVTATRGSASGLPARDLDAEKKALLRLLLAVSGVGCGGNPVSFSEPGTIALPTIQSKFISPGGPISVRVSADRERADRSIVNTRIGRS